MIRRILPAFCSLAALSACASGNAEAAASAAYRPAILIAGARAGAASSGAAVSIATRTAKPPSRPGKGRSLHELTGAARREQRPQSPENPLRVYGWRDGSIYGLRTAPEQISDIALEPGERLVSVAAGDTARWVIGDTSSGSGAARRTHVLVKPTAPGLSTNLLIATDRRVYHVELESGSGPAMASISWTYPEDSLLALQEGASAVGAPDVAIDRLEFAYRIEGDNPPWRPLLAFDDGRQVFIQFPPSLVEGEAPPLFVSGEGGRAELVNYRIRGRYYVVDRLFQAAELRLGGKKQQVVRIVRMGSRASRRSGS